MKFFVRSLLVYVALLAPSVHADTEPTRPLDGVHNESELGLVLSSGNSTSQSYNLKQLNTYGWEANLLRFTAKYLDGSANGTETLRYWTLGARFERELAEAFSLFTGENIESDRFSGYFQRYNTDVGGKYFVRKTTAFTWDFEGGYRYTIENQFSGQVKQHQLRAYTEAIRAWSPTVTTKGTAEYLPNLTVSGDYQFNAEVALIASINTVFSVKSGVLYKYRKLPPAPALHNSDQLFTTALVAKF